MTTPASDTSRWQSATGAVRRADLENLTLLIETDSELVSQRGPDGRTLLSEAARALTHDHSLPSRDAGDGAKAVVAFLLDAGAQPSLADKDGWTPLHTAGISGHRELAELLVAAGAPTDVSLDGFAGATPLNFALFYGKGEAAEVISAAGRSPDDLRAAAALGDVARMHDFLDDGRPLPEGAASGMDFYGPTEWFSPRPNAVDDQLVIDESLTWSARSGRIEAMALLVESGADVNANPYRGTPLLWSIYSDSVAAATWLLDHGADPDLRHDFGGSEHGRAATALHLAGQYGSLGCLRLLLDRGADATIADAAYDATPLGWAHEGEQPDAIAILEAHLAR